MQRIEIEKLQINPFHMIPEETFLLTAGTLAGFNTMTCGWGEVGYLWERPVASVYVRQSRYTLSFMESSDLFTISFFPPIEHNKLTYCGTHSGRSSNKVQECGLVPLVLDGGITFEGANLVFVCKKIAKSLISPDNFVDPSILKHYTRGDFHYRFTGEIKSVFIG